MINNLSVNQLSQSKMIKRFKTTYYHEDLQKSSHNWRGERKILQYAISIYTCILTKMNVQCLSMFALSSSVYFILAGFNTGLVSLERHSMVLSLKATKAFEHTVVRKLKNNCFTKELISLFCFSPSSDFSENLIRVT